MIKEFNIDVKKVLKKLQDKEGNNICDDSSFKITKGGTQISLPCPFHDDNSPSLGINTEINRYNCFVCTARTGELKFSHPKSSVGKGTFIHHFFKVFYELFHERTITLKELAEFLEIADDKKSLFYKYFKDRATITPQEQEPVKALNEEKNQKIAILKQYVSGDLSYLTNRLLQHNDVDLKKIKEAYKFFYLGADDKGNIMIPIWQDWYLKGMYVRSSGDGAKYYNHIYFKKSSHIFNYDEIKNLDDIILVEGPLNAVKLWILGYKNVVSLFGAVAYHPQIKKLQKFRRIKVWFDSDTAGVNGRKALYEQLPGVKLEYIITPEKYDAFDYSTLEINKLLGNPYDTASIPTTHNQ